MGKGGVWEIGAEKKILLTFDIVLVIDVVKVNHISDDDYDMIYIFIIIIIIYIAYCIYILWCLWIYAMKIRS